MKRRLQSLLDNLDRHMKRINHFNDEIYQELRTDLEYCIEVAE